MQVSIRIQSDLLIIAALALLIPIVAYLIPIQAIRIIVGVPYMVFAPGYVLLAALFPKHRAMRTYERMTLSFGVSIAVISTIGLLLNYTRWGLHPVAVMLTMTSFTLLCCVVGHYRRVRLPSEEHPTIYLEFLLPRWQSLNLLEKALILTLSLLTLAAIGAFIYAATRSDVNERFTEFYILGPEGLAENYPREAVVGRPVTVTVGIANREGVPAGYQVLVANDEHLIGQSGPVHLEPGGTDERPISFAPVVTGDDVEVIFFLYREGVEGPYRSLRLWLKVTE